MNDHKKETHICSICHEPYVYDPDECDDPDICQDCEIEVYRKKRAEEFWT